MKKIEEIKKEIQNIQTDDEILQILKMRDKEKFDQLKDYKY